MKRASVAALGTTATVVVEHASDIAEARALLLDELARIDAACSRFRADSDLSRANAQAGRLVRVGPLLAEAMRVALDAAAATQGIVTPMLGAALLAVGYDRTFRLVRARGTWEVRVAKPLAEAWRQVELDATEGTLRVPRGVLLDLGATAKAFAADRAAAAIGARVGRALVSLGGDISVAGEAPAGGWIVRVAEDHAAPLSSPGPTISLSAGGLATSSTTVRRWATNEGPAHHVIDPSTGRPATTHWRTVSVAAASCVDANVAALSALVLGEAAHEWLATRGVHARLLAHDGTPAYAGAWPADVEAA